MDVQKSLGIIRMMLAGVGLLAVSVREPQQTALPLSLSDALSCYPLEPYKQGELALDSCSEGQAMPQEIEHRLQ
jgi:hypothetical protein